MSDYRTSLMSINDRLKPYSNGYKAQAHQEKLHRCEKQYIVAAFGRQTGKTTAAVNELIRRAYANPGSRNWYVTNDYKQAKRNVWDLLLKFMPDDNYAKNASDLVITLPNKAKIELIGVENAESLRGAAVHFMILDEFQNFEDHIFPRILRPMLSTTGGQVWFIGTPNGLNAFYDMFMMDSEDYGRFNIAAVKIENDKVVAVTNEYADMAELQRAYNDLSENDFAQEYLAQFRRASGAVYKDWDVTRQYVPIEYDPTLPLHVSFDWGVNDPTSMIWIQPSPTEVRIIDYYEATDSNIEHFISVLGARPYKRPDLYTGDPAGRSRSLTTGTSVFDILSKKGINIRCKDNVRIPDQIRVTGGFMSRLFVANSLPRFRDCILNYRYPNPEDKKGLNRENEIPIHDEFSHAMRALEYWAVNYIEPTSIRRPRREKRYDPITGRLIS